MTPANGDPLALDVLTVGAGPTGLTLAAQLRAFGATVRVVDRQLDRVHESRALAVQPRTLEVLRGLGVAAELIARGNDAVWVQLHAGSHLVRVRLFGLGFDDTAYPFLLFVSQAETEQVLLDHLTAGGTRVERGVELVALHGDQDAVTCTLRHRDGRTEQACARYLVGCDGAASTVRRGAGIPFQGGSYPQTLMIGECQSGFCSATTTPSSRASSTTCSPPTARRSSRRPSRRRMPTRSPSAGCRRFGGSVWIGC